MPVKKNNLTFEDAFQELENIVKSLESGETNLEDSLAIFQNGMELANYCSEKLNKTELKLHELLKKNNDQFDIKNLD